ncbi:DMT family transporter [Longispora albida]|uniref:DMT family transporter n=1 Tax=Longispora albida TaxID=203523 RepID=UPI0004767A12|nr:DMT family transporter [Longispora albida]
MNLRGALMCTTAMFLVGSSVPLSRELLDYPTLAGQAARYALAAAVLLVLARGFPRLTTRDAVRLVALAATGLAGFNICLLAALREADPATVGTVIGATPVVLALAGRRSTRLVLGAVVMVIGAALVQGVGHASLAGLLWSVGALGGEVAFSLVAAPLVPRLGPIAVSAYACVFAVPLLAAASLAAGEQWRMPVPAEAGVLLYLAVVLTAGAFVIWYAGLKRLGVAKAGMFAGLFPVAALAGAAVLDGAVPSPVAIAGTVLVGAGLVFGLAEPRRRAVAGTRQQPGASPSPLPS